jgi:hypothetical protein
LLGEAPICANALPAAMYFALRWSTLLIGGVSLRCCSTFWTGVALRAVRKAVEAGEAFDANEEARLLLASTGMLLIVLLLGRGCFGGGDSSSEAGGT